MLSFIVLINNKINVFISFCKVCYNSYFYLYSSSKSKEKSSSSEKHSKIKSEDSEDYSFKQEPMEVIKKLLHSHVTLRYVNKVILNVLFFMVIGRRY